MKLKLTSLFIVAAVGIVWNTSAAVTVTGLWSNSTLGGFWSVGYGGSNAGYSAVGDSETSNGYSHAFFANGGAIYDLGTLPGGYYSRAYDVAWNPSITEARVVGYSDTPFTGNYHAISIPATSSGSPTVDLGTLGGPNSYAYDVNSSFQIVGQSDINSAGYVHAFLYSGGVMTDLGTLSGGSNSYAFGISESGKVVGTGDNGSAYHAFVYSGGVMTDLGTLGGTNSRAYAINDAGGIVGDSNIAGPGYVTHAFLYKNGTMTNLGTLNASSYSTANDINSAGEIVGLSTFSASSSTHAFFYKNGVMYDLNTLAASAGLLSNGSTVGFVTLEAATAINDGKFITGWGMYYDGTSTNYRSFALQYTAN
jgi:probable HAF family extracellular repeat protein